MKTFTCRELGGVCEQKFSGNSFMEIMQQASKHMMSDEDHTKSIMNMEKETGENQQQWMDRMKKKFDARGED